MTGLVPAISGPIISLDTCERIVRVFSTYWIVFKLVLQKGKWSVFGPEMTLYLFLKSAQLTSGLHSTARLVNVYFLHEIKNYETYNNGRKKTRF